VNDLRLDSFQDAAKARIDVGIPFYGGYPGKKDRLKVKGDARIARGISMERAPKFAPSPRRHEMHVELTHSREGMIAQSADVAFDGGMSDREDAELTLPRHGP
jgi:hypothetical protein